MNKHSKAAGSIKVAGIDLAKNTFHLKIGDSIFILSPLSDKPCLFFYDT